MTNHVSNNITVTARDLPLAAEALLQAIFAPQPGDCGGGDTFLLGFGAEASDIPDLIRATVSDIHAQATEQDATIIACEVSGIRPTDDGWRIWGTLECTAGTGEVPRRPRPGTMTCDQATPASWRISANLMYEETP